MTTPTVRITRSFSASAERVFDAWLDPSMIARFIVGPSMRDETVLKVTTDARVGGHFSFVVRRAGDEINHLGTYLVVDRPRRLSFTWHIGRESPDESRVTIDIAPVGTGCELTLTHVIDPKWSDYAERTREGWTSILGGLDASLDANDDAMARPLTSDAIRIERRLPGPIERVWRYLTEPELRAKWLAGGPMELAVGGTVRLEFKHADLSPGVGPPPHYAQLEKPVTLDGRVTRCEAPHVLAYTWGAADDASEVTFELLPDGTNVRLIVRHARLARTDEARSVTSGWHTHLAILTARLNDRQAQPFWPEFARVERLYGGIKA